MALTSGFCRVCQSPNVPQHRLRKRDYICNTCYNRKQSEWRAKSGYEKTQRHRPEGFEATHRKNQRYKLIEKAMTVLGGACVCCGITHRVYLEFDHINGGGYQEYQQTNGRDNMLRGIIKGERPDVQLLCANCHRAKTRKVSCPH